jgi:hypothetical protein
VTQFFMVDGPVTPTAAAEVDAAVGETLEKPLVVFLYTNWDHVSTLMAPEYKEAAYTVKEAEYKADFEAVDCDEPSAAAALCTPPHLPEDFTVPGLVIYHKGDAARRAISVGEMGDWIGVRTGEGVWVAAGRMTTWIKDELNKYQADDSPEMVTVEVDVDVPEAEGDGEDDAQQQGVQQREEGAADDHYNDGDGVDGEQHQQLQHDAARGGAEQQAATEPEAAPVTGEDGDDDGEDAAPARGGGSGGGGASYSFTPVAAPDPDYEPTPEPQTEEEEAAEFAARREAWEAAEGGDGNAAAVEDRGGGVLYEGGDGGDTGEEGGISGGDDHMFDGAEPEGGAAGGSGDDGTTTGGGDGDAPQEPSDSEELGIGADGHVGDADGAPASE